MTAKKFLGIDCMEKKMGNFTLLFTESLGPRIISLRYNQSENLFAELPDATLDYLDGKKYHMVGGHRLWVAPEDPALTYIPDDDPIEIQVGAGTVELIQKVEPQTGLRKIIRVQASDYPDALIIDHLIRNEGNVEMKIAPWAITQMKIGGTAILPLRAAASDSPFLPDRSLTLWPYTDVYDERIHIYKDFIFVNTLPKDTRHLKVGVSNLPNWIAFYATPYLFVKYSRKVDPTCSLDLGAEAQCYCNEKFLELETLGLYQMVNPGEEISHREIWRVVERPFPVLTPEALLRFIEQDTRAKDYQGWLK